MGTILNKKAYTQLIEENIAEIEKYMPEHSLEKKHTIEVLKWSIDHRFIPNVDEIKKFLQEMMDPDTRNFIWVQNRAKQLFTELEKLEKK